MEVRTADGRVLKTVSDREMMRAFVALLPPSEFDDIFGEVGPSQYEVRFIGPGHSRDVPRVSFSSSHVRYIPKGAAKLRKGEQAEILATLGVATE